MKKLIAVVNQKGGVGKTSISYNLSYALAAKNNNRTLLIDLDPSANASKALSQNIPKSPTVSDVLLNKELHPKEAIISATIRNEVVRNLFLIPSRINLALTQKDIANKPYREMLLSKQIEKIYDDFDYGIIDLPPMLSELTINAIYAANFIIIPIKYEKDALEGVSALFEVITEIKENHTYDYKFIRNCYDARKKVSNSLLDESLAPFIEDGKVFKTVIRQDEEINKAKWIDEPVFITTANSSGALDYLDLMKEVINA